MRLREDIAKPDPNGFRSRSETGRLLARAGGRRRGARKTRRRKWPIPVRFPICLRVASSLENNALHSVDLAGLRQAEQRERVHGRGALLVIVEVDIDATGALAPSLVLRAHSSVQGFFSQKAPIGAVSVVCWRRHSRLLPLDCCCPIFAMRGFTCCVRLKCRREPISRKFFRIRLWRRCCVRCFPCRKAATGRNCAIWSATILKDPADPNRWICAERKHLRLRQCQAGALSEVLARGD